MIDHSAETNSATADQEDVKLALCLVALMAPVSAYIVGNAVMGLAILSIAIAGPAFGVTACAPKAAKTTIAFGLLLQNMAITAAFSGHA